MKVLFTATFIFLSLVGISQSWSTELPQIRSITIQHSFHIAKVVDKRDAGSPENLIFNPNIGVVHAFFERSIPVGDNTPDIVLFIRDLSVSGNQLQAGIEFYYQDQFVFEYRRSKNWNDSDVGESLADLLKEMVLEFDASDVAVVLFKQRSINEELEQVKAMSKQDSAGEFSTEEKESRNIAALGYQIGGITLIGFDYEVRVSDVFGVHAGLGLTGYTVGLKMHVGESKNSPFFNLSLKDGGFGILRTAGVEYGGRIVNHRNENGLGFHGQVGLAKVLYIDSEFEESIYGAEGVPPVLLSIGIGISW